MGGETKVKRGAKRKFFGSALFSLGLLNSAFMLRAGFGPDLFSYILFISGSVLVISGARAR